MSLLSLPDEVLEMIIKECNPWDWMSLMRVCTRSRALALDYKVWQPTVINEFKAPDGAVSRIEGFLAKFTYIPRPWCGHIVDEAGFRAMNPELRLYPV